VTTIFVSAGEPSGDAHAAHVVAALRRAIPGIRVEGVGGAHLAAAGAELLGRIEGLTVMGFVEVVRKIPAHLRLLRAVRERLARGDVKLVVLVDYPGFHHRVAVAAHALGVPVLYYVAPQAWAWRKGRVRWLRKLTTRVAVILPFEEEFFRAHGVPATFVGHPLLDQVPAVADRRAAKAALGLDPSRPVLGVFPGSRQQEVRRMWEAFRGTAERVLDRRPEVQVVVAATPAGHYPEPGALRLVYGQPVDCLAASDAALCKSGTTTLQAALTDTPLVIAYSVHRLSYEIGRRLARVRWLGLVNLVADREIAPEFVQDRVRPDLMADALLPLLAEGSAERTRQLEDLALVRSRLGEPGASERVARMAQEILAS
jgi:lipid-A-disaccharide synthase